MNHSYRQWIIKGIIIAIVFFAVYKVGRAYDKRGDGFTLEKMTSTLTYNPEWQTHDSQQKVQEAHQILNQPFYYLGRGFQCYAFVSQDGQYVLKFFRHQRLRISKFYASLPLFSVFEEKRQKKIREKTRRMEKLFASCKLGYEKIPEHTGLVYLHLNKTTDFKQKVTIYDLLENRYDLELDNYEFMVQKKAEHLKPTFERLMKEGKLTEAQQRIDQIFNLMATCAKIGVVDIDGALISKNNIGLLKDRAIFIDTGMLIQTNQSKTKEWFSRDLGRLWRLEDWFKKNYPELNDYFLQKKEQAIASFGS